MMHEQNKHMMHALMQWEQSNYNLKNKNWLEHRVYNKNPKFWKPTFKNLTKLSN